MRAPVVPDNQADGQADDQVDVAQWAERLARHLLRGTPQRWAHVCGVAARTVRLRPALGQDEWSWLRAAAFLHDVGYAPKLLRTGEHQLDGAWFLRACGEERLARLVAHHSEARFQLSLRGRERELESYGQAERSAVSDGLTYCDLTTGPDGALVTPEARLREIEERYGPDDLVVRAQRLARPYLMDAVARTENRLRMHVAADDREGPERAGGAASPR